MPSRGEAFDFLEREGRQIFGDSAGRLVYVGHRPDTRPWWWQTFAPLVGATSIIVVDIFAPNLKSAQDVPGVSLVHSDILDLSCIGPGPGLIFWDEGPEHVGRGDFLDWVPRAVEAGWDVLTSCPWGYQAQGPDGSNLSEEHLWGPMPEDMQSVGMETRVYGEMFRGNTGHGNLIAWRMASPRP